LQLFFLGYKQYTNNYSFITFWIDCFTTRQFKPAYPFWVKYWSDNLAMELDVTKYIIEKKP
jgi:hypothetical protein